MSLKEQNSIGNAMVGNFAADRDAYSPSSAKNFRHAADEKSPTVLGIEFFNGSSQEAINRMRNGGLLVVPSAPALKQLNTNLGYRDALLNADLCIPDSSYMILVWNMMQRVKLKRLSGLEYLRELLKEPEVRQPGNTLWIMASEKSKTRNLEYLASQGIKVPLDAVYTAPIYGAAIDDTALLERVSTLRPKHVIVTVGGGTQERVGIYLKRNLAYLPAIHCIGAAIAFLSGDQVKIPALADSLYLGWLFRCISEPKTYIPRYWEARLLFSMMLRYRSKLPPAKA